MALPVVLHLINGLHAHFPRVPEIPLIYNIYTVFTEKTVAYTWMVARNAVRHLLFSYWDRLFTNA